MRPLWMMYPEDNNTLGIDTNYLFGDSYLVAATTPQLDKIKYYLPLKDDWYNFFSSKLMNKSDEIRT